MVTDLKYDGVASTSWYPGFRVEDELTGDENRTLQQILTSKSEDKKDILIRKFYSAMTSAHVVADHFHGVSVRVTSELHSSQQRVAQLDSAATEFGVRHKAVMEQVIKQAIDIRKTTDKHRKETEVCVSRWQVELDRQRKQIESLTKANESLTKSNDVHLTAVKQMKECLICPICCEVALLPKVLGTCGHHACQNCLKQLDSVAFDTLAQAAASGNASARQHLLARRCPLCRVEIIGQAFPVLALKHIASLLVENDLIEVTEATVQKSLVGKQLVFEKETSESKHMTALQLNCWAQSQLAQHSVAGVIARIPLAQWLAGVYILFEAAVSRVFFETFATTLHGKAGGVNVLVNTSQRMLAVQLLERREGRTSQLDSKSDDSTHSIIPSSSETLPSSSETACTLASHDDVPITGPRQHLIIKVTTDGRFVITVTPAVPPTADTPSASSVPPNQTLSAGSGAVVPPS